MTKPDFVIIGTQRGGTTSLFSYLTSHPLIVPPSYKELHFFSLYYDRGLDWYQAQFPTDRPPGALTGEATPYYLYHPHAPRRLHRFAPDVKLIVLLRDPVDRAYSQYHMEFARGDESLSFEEAIAREEERLRGERERMLADESYRSFAHQHYSYLARGCYVDQIRTWQELFPLEQMLFLRSEEFYRDPSAAVVHVLAFLGLPLTGTTTGAIHNDQAYSPMNKATRRWLAEHFAAKNAELASLLGQPFRWPEPA